MRFPVSICLLAFTAFAYVLQLSPYTGVFLMLFAAPFWSVVTVNGAFAMFGVEVITGLWPRLFLLLPILWFGGNLVISELGRSELRKIADQIETENSHNFVEFLPASTDLVITDSNDPEVSGLGDVLVRDFGLKESFRYAKDIPTARHLGTRFARDPLCRQLFDHPGSGGRFTYVAGLMEEGELVKGVCWMTSAHAPRDMRLSVRNTNERVDLRWSSYSINNIGLTRGDGKFTYVKSVVGTHYPLIPLPILGCALNSGQPSWDCLAQFSSGPTTTLKSSNGVLLDAASVVARALSLRRLPLAERLKSIP